MEDNEATKLLTDIHSTLTSHVSELTKFADTIKDKLDELAVKVVPIATDVMTAVDDAAPVVEAAVPAAAPIVEEATHAMAMVEAKIKEFEQRIAAALHDVEGNTTPSTPAPIVPVPVPGPNTTAEVNALSDTPSTPEEAPVEETPTEVEEPKSDETPPAEETPAS